MIEDREKFCIQIGSDNLMLSEPICISSYFSMILLRCLA